MPSPRRAQLRSIALALAIASAVASCDPGTSEDEVDIARGAELYEANCISCHGADTGGEISDIPPRHNAEGHTWHHADCDLVEYIRDGLPRRTGYPQMPAFGDRLTDAEIRSIIAYIETWWEPDQREFQQQVTEQACP